MPGNILKSALLNSVEQTQVTTTGNIRVASASGSGLAYKISTVGAINTVSKEIKVQLTVDVSGVSVPLEARLVNGSVYFEVSNLSGVSSLLGALNPSAGPKIKSLANQISGKWFEVDSTLLDEAGVSCYLNKSWTIPKTDVQQLENDYNSHPFITIKTTSSDTVNGISAEKMNLIVNNNEGAKFVRSLNGLSIVRSLNTCSKSNSALNSGSPVTLTDTGNSNITVWISKSTKQIIQIASQSDMNNVETTFSLSFNYKPVSVAVPAPVQPFTQLLKSIENLSNNSGANSSSQLLNNL